MKKKFREFQLVINYRLVSYITGINSLYSRAPYDITGKDLAARNKVCFVPKLWKYWKMHP